MTTPTPPLTHADRLKLARRLITAIGDLDPDDARTVLHAISANWANPNELRLAVHVLDGVTGADREAVLEAVERLLLVPDPAPVTQ